MDRLMKKLIFIVTFMFSITCISTIKNDLEVQAASGGVGYTFDATFPDPNMANAMASSLGKSSSDIITQSDINNLKIPNLVNKSIVDVSGLEYFTNITELYIDNNNISSFPDFFDSFPYLMIAHLDRNNLTSLPDSICNLSNLRVLGLESNKLTYLPSNIGKLKKLSELYLSFNELNTFPTSFGGLTNLQYLFVYDNDLTFIPDGLGSLTSLVQFGANHNKHLTTLPDTISNLSNLRDLYVEDTGLSSIPSAIGNISTLKSIYMNDNPNLTTLPDSLCNLSNLEILQLNNCKIESLPNSFGNLNKLKEFYIDNNSLSSLSPSFGNLTNLTKFSGTNQTVILPSIPWSAPLTTTNIVTGFDGLPISPNFISNGGTISNNIIEWNNLSPTAQSLSYSFNATHTKSGGTFSGNISLDVLPPLDFSLVNVSPIPNEIYTGDDITPSISITDGSNNLVLGTDFSVSFTDNINAGTATATLTGIGRYVGSQTVTFIIDKATPTITTYPTASDILYGNTLSTSTLSGGTANGTTIDGVISGTFAFVNPNQVITSSGMQSVIFTPDNSNYNTVTFDVNINSLSTDINTLNITPLANEIYTGANITPNILITDGTYTLVLGTDFSATYSNNLNAGTANVTLTGINGYTGTKTITFVIDKATPTITVIPTASDVLYGKTLSTSTLSGGTVNGTTIDGVISGTFVFVNTNQVITSSGMQSVIFTPDSSNYNTVTFDVNVNCVFTDINTLNIAPLANEVYTGANITPNIVITDGTYTLVLGTDFSATYSNNLNAGTASVTLTGINGYTGTKTVTFVIDKATPTITVIPTASDVLYGNTLSTSTLNGGTANGTNIDGIISGTFTFVNPNQVITLSRMQSVLFTPDSSNYNTVTVNVNVNCVSTNINALNIAPLANEIYTGANITPNIVITNGAYTLVSGTDFLVTYSNNLNAGTATITLMGINGYYGNKTINFVIDKATPTITTYPTASDILYGNNLSTSTLSGGTANGTTIDGIISGTFTFANPNQVVTSNGLQSVIFTPDSSNYNTVTFDVNVNFIPTDINTLNITPLTNEVYTGANITPNIVITDGTYTLVLGTDFSATYSNNLNAGTASVTLTGIGRYTGTKTVTFIIDKATPTITVIPTASDILYGDNLSTSTLSNATVNGTTIDGIINGTFAFVNPNQVITSSGMQSVIFTPDSSNYNTVTFDVNVNCVFTDINTLNISPLANEIYTGANITPSIVITDGTYTLVLGTDFSVTYSNNLNAGTASVTLTGINGYTGTKTITFVIDKATPTITVIPTSSDVLYGNNLSTSTLSGGTVNGTTIDGVISGTFTFVNPNQVITSSGLQSVIFTPDSSNYNTVTFDVNVNCVFTDINTLNIAPLANEVYTGANITPNIVITDGTYTLVLGTDFSVTYSNNLNAGTASVTLTGINGYTGTKTITFVIDKATPTITVIPTSSDVLYGKTLSTSTLSGGTVNGTTIDGIISGTFTFVNPNQVVTSSGMQSVIFTPNSNNYNTVTFDVNVNCVFTDINTLNIAPLANEVYTGANITPSIVITDGTYTLVLGTDFSVTYSNNLNAGTASVTLTGINGYTGTKTITFVIDKATPTITVIPTASDVLYGNTLSTSTLNGGTANGTTIDGVISGTFTFVNPNQVITSSGLQSVIFTPDSSNYNTVTTNINVNLNPSSTNIDIASLNISRVNDVIYNGQSHTPSVIIKDGTYTLIPGTDYSISFTDNINAGIATITLTGLNRYVNTKVINFLINKATPTLFTLPNVSNAIIGNKLSTLSLSGGLFNGVPIDGYINGIYTLVNPDEILSPNGKYDVLFTPNSNNYKAIVFSLPIDIPQIDISSLKINTIDDYVYTGNYITPLIRIEDGPYTLVLGKDCMVNYSNNLNSGTATITISGINSYSGTKLIDFEINKAIPTVNLLPSASDITINESLSSSTLSGGVIDGVSSEKNLNGLYVFKNPNEKIQNSGLYEVIFMPQSSNYESITMFVYVKSLPIDISNLNIKEIDDYVYTGNEITPPVIIQNGSYTLIPNVDFTIKYSNNTNFGNATITLTGTGNYTGTFNINFKIHKATPEVIIPPSASNINLNDPLNFSILTDGKISGTSADKILSGTFTFKYPDKIIKESGIYEVIFMPDNQNYNSIILMVKVNLNENITENNIALDNTNSDSINIQLPKTGQSFNLFYLGVVLILAGFILSLLRKKIYMKIL